MNQLKNIFNPQFFIILGIVVLLITCLILYIENKLKSYDHKMSSMLNIVSSFIEEMNMSKSGGSGGSNLNPDSSNELETSLISQVQDLTETIENSNLIDVSDGENSSEGSEEDYDMEEVDLSESSSSSDSDDDLDAVSVSDLEPNNKIINSFDLATNEGSIITIKKLEVLPDNTYLYNDINSIHSSSEDMDEDMDEDTDDDLDNDEESNNDDEQLMNIENMKETIEQQLDSDLQKNDINDIDEDEIVTNENENEHNSLSDNDVENLDDLENLENLENLHSIDNVEQPDDSELNEYENLNNNEHNHIDYNKLPVSKLKEIANEKKLVTNNKMKKADLLKLLEQNEK